MNPSTTCHAACGVPRGVRDARGARGAREGNNPSILRIPSIRRPKLRRRASLCLMKGNATARDSGEGRAGEGRGGDLVSFESRYGMCTCDFRPFLLRQGGQWAAKGDAGSKAANGRLRQMSRTRSLMSRRTYGGALPVILARHEGVDAIGEREERAVDLRAFVQPHSAVVRVGRPFAAACRVGRAMQRSK